MNLLEKTINNYRWQIRNISAQKRTLPSCLIVGAQKAGTSSLSHFISQHPQIHSPLQKEVHFFSGGMNPNIDNYAKGEKWYKAHFPLQKNIAPKDITFEATPMYLFHPLVPGRIKTLLPKCKIIILVRNPVERAISHFFHVVRHGYETLSIEQAMQTELSRLQKVLANKDYGNPVYRLYSYQSRGLYLEQIKRYQSFFPSNQLLILSSEQLMTASQTVLTQVFNFLDIDSHLEITNLQAQNQGGNKQKVSDEVYAQLREFFSVPNQQLFEHLGTDFNWN